MRQSIEVQIPSFYLHVRNPIGSVIPRHRDTVIVIHDQPIHRLGQSALVTISDEHDHGNEGIFLLGLEADAPCTAEEEGMEVEGASKAVGWDVGDVVFDDVFPGIMT